MECGFLFPLKQSRAYSVIKNIKPNTLLLDTERKRQKYITGSGQFPNYANVRQSAAKTAFKQQLQSVPPLNKTQHKYFQFTCIWRTNCQCAYPVIWLKLVSHQIANYDKCVIAVIVFKMTVPECAVTPAHLIKPISVSIMFCLSASHHTITQTESLSFNRLCVFCWTLKTLLWIAYFDIL